MNRYGIPKDDAKELKKNIDNSSSGNSSKYAPRYYSFDWLKANDNWKKVLCNDNIGFKISSISKNITDYGIVINTYGTSSSTYDQILAFCFQHLYMPKELAEKVFGTTQVIECIDTIENAISLINEISIIIEGKFYNISMDGITEITEEEFYDLNKWSLEDYK